MIRLTTNFGTIDIELDYKNAPVTASNFEQYVKDGHYNGLIFHRVIPGFMIQGGGFKPGMTKSTLANRSRTKPTTACPMKSTPLLWLVRTIRILPALNSSSTRRQQVPRLQERNNAGLGLCRIRQGCCRSGCC